MRVNQVLKILVLMVVTMFSMQVFAARVDKVNIKGNQRVEQSTIQEYLGINVGDEYSEQARSDAVKNLYSTSLFENISIEFNNGLLAVSVVETPFVSKVIFTGNDMFYNSNKFITSANIASYVTGITDLTVDPVTKLLTFEHYTITVGG